MKSFRPYILMTVLFIQALLIGSAQAANPKPASNQVYSQNIVIPLEGFLVRGVPSFIAQKLKPDELITVDKLFFGVTPMASALIRELIQRNYKISITSTLPADITNKILTDFQLGPGPGPSNLSQAVTGVLTAEDAKDGQFDISKWDLKDGFLILQGSDNYSNASALIQIDLGPYYFLYDSFAAVEKNRIASGPKAAFFPKTEDEWSAERFKLGTLFLKLSESNLGSKSDVRRALNVLAGEDQKHLTAVGSSQLRGNFKAKIYEFVFDPEKTKVLRCELLEVRSRQRSTAPTLDPCLADQPIKNLWLTRQRTRCGRFTENMLPIDERGIKCGDDHAFYVKAANQWIEYQETKELRNLSNQELLEQLSGPYPTKNDLFQVWDKFEDKNVSGINIAQCMDDQTNGKDLGSECLPDTLYSWGPEVKLNFFKTTVGSSTWPDSFRPLFLARSPITTFGYGPIAMRIKLKKDVIFKNVGNLAHDTCTQFAKEAATTVFYRTASSFADWIICSPLVIHSWSYGTKKHYDEMVKDHRTHFGVTAKEQRDYYTLFQRYIKSILKDLDGHVFDETKLDSHFSGHLETIEKKSGSIFFNPTLKNQEKTEAIHFATDKPNYFNPE